MTRWYKDKKREHYYKMAKKQGYRARSSYKLKQIQKKYHIISSGDKVLDLGAAPGGWSQMAYEYVGDSGLIIGVDLSRIKPIEGIIFLQSDATDESTIEKIRECLDYNKVDVILSDMAPNISGNYSMDQAKSIFLAETSLVVAEKILSPGGNFVCKVFMGEDFEELLNKIKNYFTTVKCFSPHASRKSSSETYIIGKSYKN
jgi:23S rRNA (uridine2552-2'-O)-methyltransferase